MAIAAASAGHFLPDNTEEPLLRHFGVNARFLVAIPLLIFGEPVLQTLTRDVILQFVRNGLVTDKDRARFAALVESTLRWVHRWPPWVVIAGLATAWVTLTPASWSAHDLLWAGDDPTGRPDLRFAAWWYSFVARPVFYALVLQAFAPAAFALASVLAAHWGHNALYHGVALEGYRWPAVAFAIVAAVDRRWILGETLRDEALLTAPELGPTADSMLLYEAVKRTRFVPFGRRTLVTAVAPVLAPMIPLLAIEVHLVDALKIVVSTLL